MTVQIQLACGKTIIVDNEDAHRVRQHGWAFSKHGHISGTIGNRSILLHHFIMEQKPPKGHRVIHINYDLLDFQRANLAIVHHRVACQRQPLKKHTASRYKGVTYQPRGNKWVAGLTDGSQRTHLGSFDVEEDAAAAYDKAARQHYGPYARLNFPDVEEA